MKRQISVLDQHTIDKIAAGEVVERPASVVKELVENAIDAGATAVTVEIKEGGISFIRITDNGAGIEKDQVRLAFLRHATSKIRDVDDLVRISSLGFRGEALSSISAVSQVELITKPHDQLTGTRYLIEGGIEKGMEEIGAPNGTTFLIRNLFYNTPARAKFLKTATTEAGYISSFIEQLALSHPHISFKYMQNGQTKLHTSGNDNLKEVIYQIYGRDLTKQLIEIHHTDATGTMQIDGFIGKPTISRGNRNFENYYVNGRYVKSKLIMKGIEDAYHTFMMQHKYPFTSLYLTIKGEDVDINVHPTKMEVRFSKQQEIYQFVFDAVLQGLQRKELIPSVSLTEQKKLVAVENKQTVDRKVPEPFETERKKMEYPQAKPVIREQNTYPTFAQTRNIGELKPKGSSNSVRTELLQKMLEQEKKTSDKTESSSVSESKVVEKKISITPELATSVIPNASVSSIDEKPKAVTTQENPVAPIKEVTKEAEQILEQKASEKPQEKFLEKQEQQPQEKNIVHEQMTLFDDKLLSEKSKKRHQFIGQVFETYWLVQMDDTLYIIDQHAAHEKVLYERIVKEPKEHQVTSQLLSPPMIISLNLQEQEKMKKYADVFANLGFEIESFGGREYSIRAVPQNLFGLTREDFFIEILDHLEDDVTSKSIEVLSDRMATMACKAAVKGNQKLSMVEAKALIDELLELENPYNCPHGRPTIISMTKYEMEKKFKRIV